MRTTDLNSKNKEDQKSENFLVSYFLKPAYLLNRLQLDFLLSFFLITGLVSGIILTLTNVFSPIAHASTMSSLMQDTDSEFNNGTKNNISINGGGVSAQLVLQGNESDGYMSEGTWESSITNPLDLKWNGNWGDGDSESTAFEANVSNVNPTDYIEFLIRASPSIDELSQAGFVSLGTANSGTTFVKTKSDLDNLNIPTGNNRYIQIKIVFTQSSGESPKLDNFKINYLPDENSPVLNQNSITMSKSQHGSDIYQMEWDNDLSPIFNWENATDTDSGVKGYCLYLGKDANGDPAHQKGLLGTSPVNTTGTTCEFIISTNHIDFSTDSFKGANWLESGNEIYYFIIKPVDNNNNIGDSDRFGFLFDNIPPQPPVFITSPSDYVATKAVTLEWSVNDENEAVDLNSGLTGLQYRIGTNSPWYGDNHTGAQNYTDLLSNTGSYTFQKNPDFANLKQGINIIYFRAWDNAGNVSSNYVTAEVKYSTLDPTAPVDLTAEPSESEQNKFSFKWQNPNSYSGDISNIKYCYSINVKPSSQNCTYTDKMVTSLTEDAYATVPGENYFYLIAIDESGNVNYDNYNSVKFIYNGKAPGLPINVNISDISIRSSNNWKLNLSWDQPLSKGAGISLYNIYRATGHKNCSESFSSFTHLGSVKTTAYSDFDLESKEYSYCIKACDNANNCSAPSATIYKTPTGKFTEPPNLTRNIKINSNARKALFTWTTDRESNSKIAYGTKSKVYNTEESVNSLFTQDHNVNVAGLQPGTKYYFVSKWTDSDGNTGVSPEMSFTTENAPSVKDVTVTDIGLVSARVNFSSMNTSRVKLTYGKNTLLEKNKEMNISNLESRSTILLDGLEDNMKYYFRINLYDADGFEYTNEIHDFTTLPRPQLTNIKIQEVKNSLQPTMDIVWDSNVEANSSITYYPGNDQQRSQDYFNSEYLKGTHSAQIKSLAANTDYILIVKGRDKYGNEAVSDSFKFKTSSDSRPPLIENVKIENILSSENKTEFVVSWTTDEGATSQVEYDEGIGKEYTRVSSFDSTLKINHQIIIENITPSKVYHLRIVSKDSSGNTAYSKNYIRLASKQTEKAINIVLRNLTLIFGL